MKAAGDILKYFEIMAGWRNDGTADLYMQCTVEGCEWWEEWVADGSEGCAALTAVVTSATDHWNAAHAGEG